jgi:hypothetical protein
MPYDGPEIPDRYNQNVRFGGCPSDDNRKKYDSDEKGRATGRSGTSYLMVIIR